MRSYIYLLVPVFFFCFGCEGAKIRNDFFAGIVNEKETVIGYKHHLSHEDHTNDVDFKAGLDSPDFYITKIKYEFLKFVLRGIKNSPNGSLMDEDYLTALDSLYGEASLGSHIARERIDSTFDIFVNEVYPKDNPIAQYNLGIVYLALRQYENAKIWFKKSYDNGFILAGQQLDELNK